MFLLAAFFVGTAVLQLWFLPDLSTGWRHALLTLRAVVVTAGVSGAVYFVMRRQQVRLSQTAEQLTRVIESYRANHSASGRFENPHLVRCWEVLDCRDTACPAYNDQNERCWQTTALLAKDEGDGAPAPAPAMRQCRSCEVYRRSCPDKLTELGESFNNLMFLLEHEAREVNHMRAQLIEKEKMVAIGQMATGVAHEVGNPLSSISSIVQMLKRAKSDRVDADQLDLIEKHIQRISTTVRGLVSLARPGVACWEMTDLRQALEEAVRLISFDRRARNVEIVYEPPEKLPRTCALRGQLQQVFINLSLNALDAMPDGGVLKIRARPVRQGIEISIEDSGCGVPASIGRRIFEPFFTTKEVGHGTGLGLSVSYGIVQKHGGTIDFRSAEGGGTVFVVYVPILTSAPEENHGPTNHFAR